MCNRPAKQIKTRRGSIRSLLFLLLLPTVLYACKSVPNSPCNLVYEKAFTLSFREPVNEQFQIEIIGITAAGEVRVLLRKENRAVLLSTNPEQRTAYSGALRIELQNSNFEDQEAALRVTYPGPCS